MIELKKHQFADFSDGFWEQLKQNASKRPAMAIHHPTLINHTIQDDNTIALHHSRRNDSLDARMELSGLTSQWTLHSDGTLRVKMTSLASVLAFAGLGASLLLLLAQQFFGAALMFALAAGFLTDRLSRSPEAKEMLNHIEGHRPR